MPFILTWPEKENKAGDAGKSEQLSKTLFPFKILYQSCKSLKDEFNC